MKWDFSGKIAYEQRPPASLPINGDNHSSGAMSGVINFAGGDTTRSLNASKLTAARRAAAEAEPLARFSDAKREIGKVYADLDAYVDELEKFYHGLAMKMVNDEQKSEVARFHDSIRTIRETFQRDTMKVVFFGRTSNGKSTTVNAMLHSKVLPQGMGHTTCCFLQVEGGDSSHILVEGDDKPHPIEELRELGHAMSSGNSDSEMMGQDSLVRVVHPRSDSRLLQNDVVIVDSPGVDLSPEFDSWIDKHCLDADVFVLVCNAESTLTQAEKSFFHRVAQKLSKPNVFILNNRWDASASESEQSLNAVMKQHMARFREFLVDEIQVCTPAEVKDRVFFISSREVLDSRLKAKGLVANPYQLEGFTRRKADFEKFEEEFERCISRSAILSKFQAHVRRGREIIAKMRSNVDSVQVATQQQLQELERALEDNTRRFKLCLENFAVFEKAYREQTERLRAEVHLKVSADFTEEIHRLAALVDKFNQPFVDDPAAIQQYKRALAEFTDQLVTQDLEARCTGGLMSRIWNLENDMFCYVKQILSEPHQAKLEEVWRYRAPFKFQIKVDCPALAADFHEDLEFRFSFGLSAIIRRIVAYRSGKPVTAIETNLLKTAMTPVRSQASLTDVAKEKEEESALMTQLIVTSAAYVANGGIGVILVGGILYRAVGWKVIAGIGCLYGAAYAVERLRWNSSAKEQHLKDQFRSHLAARMQQVASAHTSHCETQALREMEQVHEGLRAMVGGVHREMKEALDAQRKEIETVDSTIKGLNSIKGKTTLAQTNLERFEENFLRTDSPA